MSFVLPLTCTSARSFRFVPSYDYNPNPSPEIFVFVQYSTQKVHIVRETPALYERIVRPYINAFPASRTQWLAHPSPSPAWPSHSSLIDFYNRIEEIISGRSEAEKILFRSPPEATPFGFLILPDMKWDLVNTASLYLVALMLLPNIKSLRDLNRSHLPLLHAIRREAANVAKTRWGLEGTELRLFVHYQPSYCKLRLPSSQCLKFMPFNNHGSFSRPHRECKSYQSQGDGGWSVAYAR